MTFLGGPQALSHPQRMAIVDEIVARIKAHFSSDVFAIGLYGSVAREEDGPYSDIEMLVVLRKDHVKQCYEWCTAEWKAEVDIYDRPTLLARARRVDDRWPLTHSALQTMRALYDPEQFFEQIRVLVQSAPEALFREAIEELLQQEVYEEIGKIRNARVLGYPARLPALVLELIQDVAMVVGLAHRHCYTTGTEVVSEAIALPDLPDGFGDLGRLFLTGDLRDGQRLGTMCERLWQGIHIWAQDRGYRILSQERIPF